MRPLPTAPRKEDHACTAIEYPPHAGGTAMNLSLNLAPIVALIAGILILAVPRMLNYIVAIYLIVIGVLGLMNGSGFHLH
jgi:hypothetical protein